MFKFDFNIGEDCNTDVPENDLNEQTTKCNVSTNALKCNDSREVLATKTMIEDFDIWKLNSTELPIGTVNLIYMIPTHVLHAINVDSNIQKAEENHTDLIPGVYEGGAKLWECTEDLLRFLQARFSNDLWKSKYVLDLGCGCGLLGIFAMKFGSIVHFQDYNEDVLEKVTIPNVLLNYDHSELNLKEFSEKAKFFSGDWSRYSELTKEGPLFDIILTSETIYNPQNHKKLLETLAQKLKPDGLALVAAKAYYFGVGGCIRQFECLVKADKRFSVKAVWSSDDGIKREILQIQPVNLEDNNFKD